MKKLIALIAVLYLSRQYKPGEELPASDPEMVKAWLDAKSASWVDAETDTGEDGLPAKIAAAQTGMAASSTWEDNNPEDGVSNTIATLTAAQAGMTGSAVPSTGEDDLTGKVPITEARKRAK